MKLLEKILVATDFGLASEDAVRMTGFIAKQFDSRVYLVHVKSPTIGPMPTQADPPPSDAAELDHVISERLDAVAEQLVEAGARSVESLLLEGIPSEQIAGCAEREDVNVILIGAGELGPSGQVYLGTTAARLRRTAASPVWIVKPGTAPPIKRILCPVDFSLASGRALKNAIHLARTLQAELTVLTITQSPLDDYQSLFEKGQAGPSAAARPGPLSTSQEPADQPGPRLPQFDEFLRRFDFHDVRWRKMITPGKPRYEIVRVAREIGAELIVMGSAGRQGLSRMLIGGAARRVAQELPCSVITVRSNEPIRLTVDKEVPAVDVQFCESHPPAHDCARFRHGEELLERGLADEAMEHFRGCTGEYPKCPRAWRQLATAHARLGQHAKAQECEKKAEQVTYEIRKQQVDDELRDQHILHRRIFGI